MLAGAHLRIPSVFPYQPPFGSHVRNHYDYYVQRGNVEAIINVGFDASSSFNTWVILDPEIILRIQIVSRSSKSLNNCALSEFEINGWDLILLDPTNRVQ